MATYCTVTERIDYDEWGNVTASSGAWSVQPFGYAGGLHDAATGLVRFGVRDYDPVTGTWTAKEPLGFAAETNFYAYAMLNPIEMVDPHGTDAIYVVFPTYSVDTGLGFHAPLGHAAVISVDPATGGTRYYEYGRYDARDYGVVRRRTIPDLAMGADGRPTEESMNRLLAFVSRRFGKRGTAHASYFDDVDHQAVIDYAEGVRNDPDRGRYNILARSCYTFAQDTIVVARDRPFTWFSLDYRYVP